MSASAPPTRGPRPDWLRAPIPGGPGFRQLKGLVRDLELHSICEAALCPNIGDCWQRRTATFLLLGEVCTRNCGFCAVATGRPGAVDPAEPHRLAQAIKQLGLRHIVLTSVTRDDLPDGGASVYAETIRQLRRASPGSTIEVLVPDFQGNWAALEAVMAAGPDILAHNMETVPRLYRRVRPKAIYARSLELLQRARALAPQARTKSGLMVGLGERVPELQHTFSDLRAQGVDILTVGQYLRPTLHHLPVERYYTPDEFGALKRVALALGFRHVEAGPLVRSSYHADEQVR
ncbi:MAG: lipoyl synthase [Chloroflexi bacterium]|nr:lipoyl synthase [Chloroflexota bacterium]